MSIDKEKQIKNFLFYNIRKNKISKDIIPHVAVNKLSLSILTKKKIKG